MGNEKGKGERKGGKEERRERRMNFHKPDRQGLMGRETRLTSQHVQKSFINSLQIDTEFHQHNMVYSQIFFTYRKIIHLKDSRYHYIQGYMPD